MFFEKPQNFHLNPKTFTNPQKTKIFPSKSKIPSRNLKNYVHQHQIFTTPINLKKNMFFKMPQNFHPNRKRLYKSSQKIKIFPPKSKIPSQNPSTDFHQQKKKKKLQQTFT